MISIRYNKSLANCMFQYALGRILAERFGFRLKVEPLGLFPATRNSVHGEEVFGPVTRWFGHWPIDHDLRCISREELHQSPGAKLSLCGAFQRFELFAEHRDRIRKDWFRFGVDHEVRPSSDFLISLAPPDDILEGRARISSMDPSMTDAALTSEALLEDSILNAEEIRRLARAVDHDQLYIATGGNPHDGLEEQIKDLRPIFVAGSGVHEFLFLAGFQKLAISQSSTHWWAAFLGAAKEVYFPPLDRGVWAHPSPPVLAQEPSYHGIDLRVAEDRFIYDW